MSKKQAFERFYQEHVDKVYRFVFFRCGDRELAEDLVSEIFIKILNHFDSYDAEVSKTAWVMTITKNHLANYWRDKKAVQSLDAVFEEDGEVDEGQWLKQALVVSKKQESKRFAEELLANLSPEDAEIVTLHYIIGYNYAEIAAIKNMTEGAVKVAAHRAIHKMKKHI